MDVKDKHLDEIQDILSNQNSSTSHKFPQPDIHSKGDLEVHGYQTISKLLPEDATHLIIKTFVLNCKNELNLCLHINDPSALINVPEFKSLYCLIKNTSIKIRLITEINSNNLKYCKQLNKEFEVELRHLDNVKGNFGISDGEQYITSSVLENSKSLNEIVYSNVKGIVEQNTFMYEILWNKGTPLDQKIKEIEDGLSPIETKVLVTPDTIINQCIDFIKSTSNVLCNCSSTESMEMVHSNNSLFDAYRNRQTKFNKGEKKGGIRWITFIENDIKYVNVIRKYLEIGIEVRHCNILPPLNFGVSDKQVITTVESLERSKLFQTLLYSTEPSIMNYFQSIFDELWKTGIDAQKRIRQIEKGLGSEITKLIENPFEIKSQLSSLIQNANEEILIIFPSITSINIQSNYGFIEILLQKCQQDVKVRILCPLDKGIKNVFFYEYEKNQTSSKIENMTVREINIQKENKPLIFLIDRKHALVIELKDNSQLVFEEAIGIATYSTSKFTVLSYMSIFESLWDQTEMYNDLRTANENLKKTNDKLIESEQIEREFINTAAHELRTPTQAIAGYSEFDDELFTSIMKNKKEIGRQELERIFYSLHNHHEDIARNATRLTNLINNLLDVARIDSSQKNRIMLNNETFDLTKEIRDQINLEHRLKLKDKNIRVNFINETFEESCLVYADKSRLNQILTNLLDSAIKFSKQDTSIEIMIRMDELKEQSEHNNQPPKRENQPSGEIIYVAVSDSGRGISQKILPNLFEKFMTDSDIGTGLGLYISKRLVEAMGGRIWAYNNNDGIGSTFVFSLPKAD